uniref:Phage tail collar domain-containing protein n=1 Tax=viral metagenome TaxID=1070528 RepID=A0A6C0IUZ8_9ZZZZ
MNLQIRYYIIVVLFLTLIYLKYENFCDKKKIEMMSNTDTIINQLDKKYGNDIQSIRKLSQIVLKLQGKDNQDKKNTLTIPYNVRIEGNLTLEGTLAYLPKGSIIEFTGKVAPIGWNICDGTKDGKIDKSIPDLRERFIVGYKSKSEYNKIGNTGGTNVQKITIDNIPSHSHTIKIDGEHTHNISLGRYKDRRGSINNPWKGNSRRTINGGTEYTKYAGNHSHGGNVVKTGDNTPYDNRPPYYVLMYIIKK